ncbi:MAG TPA: neutral zinc metallopeptidase [Chitinophagaceae bacterium]|nr:neutral zinc metallopeptidase [Chitinophagaceae bacterium]
MLWKGGRQSGNVDDRRGMSGGQVAVGGGILGVIALVLNFLIGGDVDTSQLPQIPGIQNSSPSSPEQQAADDERAGFVKTVLAYTEDVWNEVYQKSGQDYPEPTLVLFRDAVQSGCGNASAASGPFYCPADQQLYIDLAFYNDLENKFGASGDFAMAYVVAHEVGHHIQTLNGTSKKIASLRGRVSQEEYNQYSVRLELQADFLAGVWAHYMKGKTINGQPVLEPGDFEEALNAANAIGDDRLTQGRVSEESFTHGTSAQRMYWFKKGYDTGDINQGDTFSARELN